MGADLIVEVALRHDRSEWPRLVPQLCAGDAELEALVRALLVHYDRPDAPLPDGPYPCTVGPFTLERELGAGAHGKVYLARRPPLDGYVALKLLRPGPGMSEFVEQVRREAGRARRIPSAHVVPVFDAGRIDGGPFYVEMAVCADPDEESPGSIRIGRSLRDAQPGLAPEEAARLVEDLARAVHAAHRTGIVHGDVKPENVLLTPETHRVMLADFGIATSLAASVASGSTPIGTIAYMAPEQWRDRLAPSPASDVYTLGGTLYFLLSGAAPHARREAGGDAPPPPLPAAVPPRLREIVQRALAPRPEDRPPSAAALAEELARYRALEPTWHDRRSLTRRALLFARRHARELAAAAAVLAIVLPLGIAGYHVLIGRVGELAAREAELRGRIDDLARSRADLERDVAKLEGAADAKQKELARTEGRLQQLPRLEQALGAAKEQAAQAEAALARRDAEARDAAVRAATLEAQLAGARDALAESQGRERAEREESATREASAREDAGRAAGERDEARRRLSDAEARVRTLEREVRDKDVALAAARAAEAARASTGAGVPAPDARRGAATPASGTAPAGTRRPAGEGAAP
ncbi:serine/threonine-protein kinase [Anaeromyxobacter oryzae]|nr:serine/threonine-protein kinase [Anaeromyxobacter oryzae]